MTKLDLIISLLNFATTMLEAFMKLQEMNLL